MQQMIDKLKNSNMDKNYGSVEYRKHIDLDEERPTQIGYKQVHFFFDLKYNTII